MPINRSYMCPECATTVNVVLSMQEWDAPPPSCPACDAREMQQDFKPPAIGGSVRMRAAKITEDIIANDYNVANYQSDRRVGGVGKTRYKDQSEGLPAGQWTMAGAAGHKSMLETAIGIGRANRGKDGLDILKANLASGAQPDLIEASKRRSIKVW